MSFTLTGHGKEFLLECYEPSAYDWWGKESLNLTDEKDPVIVVWNSTLQAYIVKDTQIEEAEYFIHRTN